MVPGHGGHRVAESHAENQAAVPGREEGVPVGIHPVRGVTERRVLDDPEHVDGDRVEPAPGFRAHWPGSASPCSQAARFASGSSTSANASSGPLISELGPGPWPNSMHWPVEITPMVRKPGR